MNKILLVGCGHMGSALLKAWHKKTSDYFTIIDPVQYKELNKIYKKRLSAFRSIEDIKKTESFNIIIFAVKPQIAKMVVAKFYSISNATYRGLPFRTILNIIVLPLL